MSDFTNGYRIYSRRAVEHLTRAPLRETGYISLSEWAYIVAPGRNDDQAGPDSLHQSHDWESRTCRHLKRLAP